MKRQLGLRVCEAAPRTFRFEDHNYTLDIHGGRVALVCANRLSLQDIEDLRDALPCSALVVNYPAEIEVLEVIERRTRSERFLEVLDTEEVVASEVPTPVGPSVSRDLDRYTYTVTWSEGDQLYVGLCAELEGPSFKASTRGEALDGIVQEVTNMVTADPCLGVAPHAGPTHTVRFHITWHVAPEPEPEEETWPVIADDHPLEDD